MASQEEQTGENEEHSTIPTLALFSLHNIIPPSPEHPWMSTPPLYTTSASIPFTWEEEPGKPRSPSSPPPLTHLPTTASNILEPPPGLTKTPSPNTVLDGPYPKFISSSFRFLNEENLDNANKKTKKRRLLVFPSWRQRTTTSRNGKKENVGNHSSRSFVFPSTCSEVDSGFQFDEATSDKNVNISRISSRNGSINHGFSPKPQFWASVYQGFKHAIPWKTSRKSRKDEFIPVGSRDFIKHMKNDTILRGGTKSDAREMQSFYQHYYRKYIQAQQNAADKTDRARLIKAYQTADVLLEVSRVVNITKAR